MASFRKDNGKNGIERVRHTTSGYECAANYPGNMYKQRAMFFTRHVVDCYGYPYIEIGLKGIEPDDHEDALLEIKNSLKASGFCEVRSFDKNNRNSNVFTEYNATSPESIAVRVNAGSDGISKVVEIMCKFILESSKQFVQEQEGINDVLFRSILCYMGPEMDKSPGGHKSAVEKARQLAKELEEGYA